MAQARAALPPAYPPGASELAKTAVDVSIVAAAVVVAVIIIVAVTVYLMVSFLHGFVDTAGRLAPPSSCVAWLEARRLSYLTGRGGGPRPADPATGRPYTSCQAAAQAVHDAQAGTGGACPAVASPPPAVQQSPFAGYLAAQRCAPAAPPA
jgi:hypothetical protein